MVDELLLLESLTYDIENQDQPSPSQKLFKNR